MHQTERKLDNPAWYIARRGQVARPRPYPNRNSSSAPKENMAILRRDSDSDNTVRYPGDLVYHGGAVLEFVQSHDVYLLPGGSCASASCFGDPERFLRALGKSEFMHVTDQYVRQHSSNRYTLGENFSLAFSVSTTPLIDLYVQTIVHAVAKFSGETGYGHIYHVFIPPGQDECFDSTFTVCASNVFCAYHSSVDFTDIGHVVYSVEPFADVPGCRVRPGTPNGTLTDSTNRVLSHELIEAITDPDGDAWWNNLDVGLFGEEIGDECSLVLPPHYFCFLHLISLTPRSSGCKGIHTLCSRNTTTASTVAPPTSKNKRGSEPRGFRHFQMAQLAPARSSGALGRRQHPK
jgi:hypothetical protein